MKTKLLKNHICAFNDGEQSCECYKKACEDIIEIIETIKSEPVVIDACHTCDVSGSIAFQDGELEMKCKIRNKIKEI